MPRDDEPDARIDSGDGGPTLFVGFRDGNDIYTLAEAGSGTVALWRDG